MKKQLCEAYMTVEAALVMSVVLMVYVFLIDTMLLQYNRCVTELEAAEKVVLDIEADEDELLYDVTRLNPMDILRLQRSILKKREEEKVK